MSQKKWTNGERQQKLEELFDLNERRKCGFYIEVSQYNHDDLSHVFSQERRDQSRNFHFRMSEATDQSVIERNFEIYQAMYDKFTPETKAKIDQYVPPPGKGIVAADGPSVAEKYGRPPAQNPAPEKMRGKDKTPDR